MFKSFQSFKPFKTFRDKEVTSAAVKVKREEDKKKVTLADIPHVGPGTPCGEWFRRYWVVVGTAQELYDIPQAVKVLGEELVLFRDQFGQGGSARRALSRIAALRWNTAISRTADCVVRITVGCSTFDGQCLEMPAEPKDSKFCQKVKHLSYPVKELGGLSSHTWDRIKTIRRPCRTMRRSSSAAANGRSSRCVMPNTTGSTSLKTPRTPPMSVSCTGMPDTASNPGAISFLVTRNMPHFEFVEMDYGMKVVMTKPGPEPGTEFVDEMSLALPSIVQVGDTEFVHAKVDAAALIKEGSQVRALDVCHTQ